MPPKKSKPAPQASLFRRDVPKMPEGYYTPGPNPNLRRFVEEHATPYDPATDDYDVPPFDQPITGTKATAIYNMHTYWSKKPHDAIQQYIRHYTKSGELVLDPFSGSGGTSLAALLEGRAAIAIDLSPAATFITASYISMPEIYSLETGINKISCQMSSFLAENCTYADTGEYIKAVVYTEQFRCSKCYEVIPFIEAETGEIRNFRGRENSKEVCSKCGEPLNTAKDQRFGFIPAELHLTTNVTGGRIRVKKVLHEENVLVSYPAKPKQIPDILRIPFDGNIPPRLSKNIAKAGVSIVGELFSDLNLRILLEIKRQIDTLDSSENTKQILKLALNSILLNSSRMYRHRIKTAGGGGFSGTYYIPHLSKCINPWNAFLEKCEEMIRGVEEIQRNIIGKNVNVVVSTETATEIYNSGHIPANSIDYVFTDPPYGGTFHYGALNFVWEIWNQLDISYRPNEVVISEDGSITFDDWTDRIKQSLQQIFYVLKPGHWMSLCFHGEVELWSVLHDALAEVGFVAENPGVTLYLDTNQKSYNQNTGETSKKRDLIINFRKPRNGELASKILLTGEENLSSFKEKAGLILCETLEQYPGAPTDRLYDELVSRMVRKGEFQRHNFDALLRSVAEETGGRWYLLETADQLDETEGKKENASAARLEAFMEKYMQAHPGEGGVHYSNLFEEYLPISDKPRRLLQDWLPEYFYKTESGTWRPPLNEEERQVKTALRLSGELRHIKRFANALSAGVPPAERDRPANAATLAEWLYQCRRSGLYELGRILYERGGLRFDSLGEDAQMQVEEDYQICVKRGSLHEKKNTRKKKEQLELL